MVLLGPFVLKVPEEPYGCCNDRTDKRLSFERDVVMRIGLWTVTTIFSDYFPARQWPVSIIVWEKRVMGRRGSFCQNSKVSSFTFKGAFNSFSTVFNASPVVMVFTKRRDHIYAMSMRR